MGKKSQNLRRAGWEIISCWEGVYHKRIHGFAICFLVTAVLVSSPEFHTLSQTEWLVLLAMIWKSFGYRRSLWHLIKVLMFVDKNLYLYYFNWWYGRGHIFFGERVEIMNDTIICLPPLYSGGLCLLITHFLKLEEWRSQKTFYQPLDVAGGMILLQTVCLDMVSKGTLV